MKPVTDESHNSFAVSSMVPKTHFN